MGDQNTEPADQSEQDDLGYWPNVNQVRDEPVPASHEEDPRQEAVERNEQYAGGRSAKPDGEVNTQDRPA
jgi:hypothetical protein